MTSTQLPEPDTARALNTVTTRARKATRRARLIAGGMVAAVAAAAVVVVVSVTVEHGSTVPATSSTPPSPAATREAVGEYMQVPLSAEAPAGWDATGAIGSIKMVGPQGRGTVLLILGPVSGVFDPATSSVVATPKDYAAWLRHHPWLTVLEDRTVVVDGRSVPQLTVQVKADATVTNRVRELGGYVKRSELPIAGYEGLIVGPSHPWEVVTPLQTLIITVLTSKGETVLVTGTASTDELATVLLPGLDDLLTSMTVS